MTLGILREFMRRVPEYQRLRDGMRGGARRLTMKTTAKSAAFTLAALRQDVDAPTLVVAPRPEDARRLYEQLLAWCGDDDEGLLHFTESEILPFERLDSDTETVQQRLRALSAVSDFVARQETTMPAGVPAGAAAARAAHADSDAFVRESARESTRQGANGHRSAVTVSTSDKTSPPLVVASVGALMQRTLARDVMDGGNHTLRRGEQVELSDMLDLWRRMGYRFESAVYAPGVVSRRGGIIDIFPVAADTPARIELWGNEIDSIRHFDPATQRSGEVVDTVQVSPAHEILPSMTPYGELERLAAFVDVGNCTPSVQARIREELELLMEGQDVEEQGFYAGFFNQGGIADYFAACRSEDGSANALLVAYKPDEIADAAWEIQERGHQLRETKEARGELPRNFPSSHLSWNDVEAQFAQFGQRLNLCVSSPVVSPWEDDSPMPAPPGTDGTQGSDNAGANGASRLNGTARNAADDSGNAIDVELPFLAAANYYGNLERFVEDVWELSEEDNATVVAVSSHSRRLSEIFAGEGVDVTLADSLDRAPSAGSITLMQSAAGGLSDGFSLPLHDDASQAGRLVVFSDVEIFGVAKQRRTRRRSVTAARDAFLSELSPGDYVVHVEHGIGRFAGTVRGVKGDESADDDREYLAIEYANDDKLYVPLEHLDRVAPYIAPMDRPPSLTRLGTQEWRRAKQRAERSTREMASELLALYAARELAEGHSFVPDAQWQSELEESFPFEETPDQQRTIDEVKADMESLKPMDRLVCGDVGYGKTEIALRAAFKAVMDGKQVAVLVPTTVLAQQHYSTFSQRLSAFPTRVEVLSRFRTPQEQRDVVERLSKGEVDICIGTHRLIQRDVRFKELGLVIVDEEQRFGVAHKERLKRMREEVDVLTLTATPIPRSLHMALAGVRDMSTMETPPEERLPIKTYVSEISDALTREAILREIDRQGQVYFLHNRVYNIDYMARYIGQLVPEARVGVAHGQMGEGELEDVMLEFAEHNLDVLVCTTIIESGLDIPNVNTLIINRADTLGLSQLYQLRGRVGRSARRAYCYLLVPPSGSLTEPAEKRLRAMLDASELGAGFRIAMKDLEIRGAGNILGAEQSGNIHAVGFDLYTRLLSNAVEELRARGQQNGAANGDMPGATSNGSATTKPMDGSATPSESEPAEPTLDIGVPASIPEDYIEDLPSRLRMYQHIVTLNTSEPAQGDDDVVKARVGEIEDELRDRFGPLPWQVRNLLYATRLRLYAKQAGIESVTRERNRVVLRYGGEIGGARRAMQRALSRQAEIGNTQVRLPMESLSPNWEPTLETAIKALADFTRRTLAAQVGLHG
ncbi:MAG: transcription-repair coupling factor [Chloroflexi bacterium]|nr:transcription-repair coupling factor [Chloroflexota bacterium]